MGRAMHNEKDKFRGHIKNRAKYDKTGKSGTNSEGKMSRKKLITISILTVVCIIAVCAAGFSAYYFPRKQLAAKAVAEIEVKDDIDFGTYANGNYLGESTLDSKTVKVQFMVTNGKLNHLVVTSGINAGNKAVRKLVPAIEFFQTLKIEDMKGYEYESKMIKKAIENATMGAGLGLGS